MQIVSDFFASNLFISKFRFYLFWEPLQNFTNRCKDKANY